MSRTISALLFMMLAEGCAAVCSLGPAPTATPPGGMAIGTKSWSPPQELQSVQLTLMRDTSLVAVAPAGQVTAVWIGQNPLQDDRSEHVYAMRYDPTTNQWGAATALQTTTEVALSAAVSHDAQGNVVVVWIERSHSVPIDEGGTGRQFSMETAVYADRYDAVGQRWEGARLIRDRLENAGGLQLSMSAAGDAVAVWTHQCLDPACVLGSRYVDVSRYRAAQADWTIAVHLNQSAISQQAGAPHAAIDANRNAIVAWEEVGPKGYRVIYASCYNAETDRWGAPEIINQTNYGTGFGPWVVMDPQGNAIAVWSQWFSLAVGVGGTTLDRSHGRWNAPERVDRFVPNSSAAYLPKLAVAATGDAILVSYMYSAIPTLGREMASLYNGSRGWYGDTRLDQTVYTDPRYDPAQGMAQFGVDAAMDPYGNALAIWSQLTDGNNTPGGVYARRFRKGIGWEPPQKVDAVAYALGVTPMDQPHVEFDAQGNAVAVWMESDRGAIVRVMAARYQ